MSQPDQGQSGLHISDALVLAQHLKIADISSLQNEQTFDESARRCFSTWETSLMSSDLQALEEISLHERLRKYVTTIRIQDDWERNDPGPMIAGPESGPPESAVHIWPRGKGRLVQTEAVGVASLREILTKQRLCPGTITIRDFRPGNVACDPEPCAMLAQEILDGTGVAITSFTMQRPRESYGALELIVSVSPKDHSPGIGSSMLRSAQLISTRNLGSYWPEQLCRPLNLLDLSISHADPRPSTDKLFEDLQIAPRLASLSLTNAVISSEAILGVLDNSWTSLTSISIRTVRLVDDSWQPLLSQIAKRCTCLASFNLGLLSVDSQGAGSMKSVLDKERIPEQFRSSLELTEKGLAEQRRINAVRYRGPDVAKMLIMIAKSMTKR